MAALYYTPTLDHLNHGPAEAPGNSLNYTESWKYAILCDSVLCVAIAFEIATRHRSFRDALMKVTSTWNLLEMTSILLSWIQLAFIYCTFVYSQLIGRLVIWVLSYGKVLRLFVFWRYISDTALGHKVKVIFVSIMLAWKDLFLFGVGTLTFTVIMGLAMLFDIVSSPETFTVVSEAMTWVFACVMTVGYGSNTFALTGVVCSVFGIGIYSLIVCTVWTYAEITEMAVSGCGTWSRKNRAVITPGCKG